MNDTRAHITGLREANCSCLARTRMWRLTVFIVCACVSYPSWSRRSRSAMSFGLTVTCRLTFEPPSLHYALKALTNATKTRKLMFAHSHFQAAFTCWRYKKRGLHFLKSITDLSSKQDARAKRGQEVGKEARRRDVDEEGKLAEQNLRFACDVHILARTEMCCIQGSAWTHHT